MVVYRRVWATTSNLSLNSGSRALDIKMDTRSQVINRQLRAMCEISAKIITTSNYLHGTPT